LCLFAAGEQIEACIKAGKQIRPSGKSRLLKYYADPISANDEMRRAAKSSREGDHGDDLLGSYGKFFANFNPAAAPPIPGGFDVISGWIAAMSRSELFGLFNVFRAVGAAAAEKSDSPSRLTRIHHAHCDVFEYHFGAHRVKNPLAGPKPATAISKGLELIEFLQMLALACRGVFKEHPPPPRPVQVAEMMLDNMANVVPVMDLLIALQVAKDNRQGAVPPPGTTVYPDQTVLSNFIVWSFHFFSWLTGLYVKGPTYTAMMANAAELAPPAAAPTDAAITEKLAGLMTGLTIPADAEYTGERATLYVHQVSAWLSLPQYEGLKIRPWVIDVLYPAKAKISPVRIGFGSSSLYGARPCWTSQITAFVEHMTAHGYKGSGAVPGALSFTEVGEAAAAAKVLTHAPFLIGCNTNHVLDRLAEGPQTTAADQALVSTSTKGSNEELYWMTKAEPLAHKGDSKGRLTYDYVRMWFKRAAAFYRTRPWERCPEECALEVEIHGFGKRQVIISGSDGGQVALRVFKPYKALSSLDKHESVVFMHPCGVPFKDIEEVEKYKLEVARPWAIPTFFTSFTTFKRPPYAELEVYRICFEVIPKFLATRTLSPKQIDEYTAEAGPIRESYMIDVPSETKPLKAEISFPSDPYREDVKAPRPVDPADPTVLAELVEPGVSGAYDAVLQEFLKNGPTEKGAELVCAAVKLNPYPIPFILGQKLAPSYRAWAARPAPKSAAGIASRQAVAYIYRSLTAWRAVDPIIPWFEAEAAKARALPVRVVKCDYPPCLKCGVPDKWKRWPDCEIAVYCNTQCQKDDWPRYKLLPNAYMRRVK